MTRAGPADGLLLLDKAPGVSSHSEVERVRRHLGIRRIGHAGTLDPFATGLLVLLVGRATRLLPYLDNEPKVYDATIRFGAATTTDDATGDVTGEAAPPPQDVVERCIQSLTGHLLQRPPAYSAKQVKGVRAYRAARRGEPLTLEPVGVTVHEWTVLGREGNDLRARITCSGGTYVRALARDLGAATGSVAHLAGLRRERSGRFDVADARTAAAIEDESPEAVGLLPPTDAVRQLPVRELDDLEAQRVVHGQSVAAHVDSRVHAAALWHGGELLAIGVREGDMLRPRVVMKDA